MLLEDLQHDFRFHTKFKNTHFSTNLKLYETLKATSRTCHCASEEIYLLMCTWQRRAGGRRSRCGGIHFGCGVAESQSDVGKRQEVPDSPCCPSSCTDPDSSSGRYQNQSRLTGQWLRHWGRELTFIHALTTKLSHINSDFRYQLTEKPSKHAVNENTMNIRYYWVYSCWCVAN